MSPSPERERYLVGYGRAAKQRESPPPLPDLLDADPEVEVLEQKGGRTSSELFVVSMTADHAARLQEEFADDLVVERDAPLEL